MGEGVKEYGGLCADSIMADIFVADMVSHGQRFPRLISFMFDYTFFDENLFFFLCSGWVFLLSALNVF